MQSTIYIELNSTTDNPLVFADAPKLSDRIVSQGNFHGEILALCADRMSLALFELGSISERRMDQLLDPSKSGLTPFLAADSGLESGLMIVQYSAGAALAELHGHAGAKIGVLDQYILRVKRIMSAWEQQHVGIYTKRVLESRRS